MAVQTSTARPNYFALLQEQKRTLGTCFDIHAMPVPFYLWHVVQCGTLYVVMRAYAEASTVEATEDILPVGVATFFEVLMYGA